MLRKTDEAYLRMLEEKAILEKRVETLDNFIKDARESKIDNITLSEIHLLEEQLHYMRGYLRILSTRIFNVK